MATKRYYWLKMQETFFSQKEIKKLRRQYGADMVLLYLQIMLLSIKNNGRIQFDGYEDSMADEIALVLDADENDVKQLLEFLESHNLLTYISDQELELSGVVESIGSESDAAERMRRSREKKSQDGAESVTMLQECSHDVPNGYTEKEKELEREKETEKESEKDTETDVSLLRDPPDPGAAACEVVRPTKAQPVPYQRIMEAYNNICGDYLPRIQKIDGTRQRTVAARFKDAGSLEELIKVFEIVRESEFLTGRTESGWKAGFDWIMKPSNYQKILEGNYSGNRGNKGAAKQGGTLDTLARMFGDEMLQEYPDASASNLFGMGSDSNQ